MEFAQRVPVILECRERGKGLGDFVLGIAMLWQDALDTRYDASGFVGPKSAAALRYRHFSHPSQTMWLAGTVAAFRTSRFCSASGSWGPPASTISTADDFCQHLVT
jgi:hypothetical protein